MTNGDPYLHKSPLKLSSHLFRHIIRELARVEIGL
jgi:hypothetical protein